MQADSHYRTPMRIFDDSEGLTKQQDGNLVADGFLRLAAVG
jgi:hypothetical protein